MRRTILTVSRLRIHSHKLLASIWLFPILLAFILVLLTGFRISGTSVGIYFPYLFGDQKDPSLITGKPQSVRSDEWLVNTQLTIAQSQSGFPRVNENMGSTGRDMSLDIDVPYREWSVLFKPQNLIFFLLPLEYAFAFKWWLLLYILIIACYFLVLHVFPGRRLFAALMSLAVALSPYVFWWYQTTTIGSLAYGFLILLFVMKILDNKPISLLPAKHRDSPTLSLWLFSVLLAYLLVCFGLLLYPAFQLPVVIVCVMFVIGYLLTLLKDTEMTWREVMMRCLPIAGAVLVAGSIVGAFILTRSAAVKSIAATQYPGARYVESGGYAFDRLMGTFLQPQLQRGNHGLHYYLNQSESSNFLLILPYIFIAGLLLTYYRWRKERHIDYVFVMLQVTALLFFANLFVPLTTIFAKLTLLTQVPHERLSLGLGFLGVLHLLFMARNLSETKIKSQTLTILAAGYTSACLMVALAVGHYTIRHFPDFISNYLLVVSAAVVFCSVIYLLLSRRFILMAGTMAAFSLLCVYNIHPLYRGLGPVVNSKLSTEITSVSRPSDSWASLDDIYVENAAVINNRDSLTGVQIYPDVMFWEQVSGNNSRYIYNRYAHVLLSANPNLKPLKLLQPDLFVVHFTCSTFILNNVDYVLTEQLLNEPCATTVSTVRYPARTFYIYRINK